MLRLGTFFFFILKMSTSNAQNDTINTTFHLTSMVTALMTSPCRLFLPSYKLYLQGMGWPFLQTLQRLTVKGWLAVTRYISVSSTESSFDCATKKRQLNCMWTWLKKLSTERPSSRSSSHTARWMLDIVDS